MAFCVCVFCGDTKLVGGPRGKRIDGCCGSLKCEAKADEYRKGQKKLGELPKKEYHI
jgi:hypothetical protein